MCDAPSPLASAAATAATADGRLYLHVRRVRCGAVADNLKTSLTSYDRRLTTHDNHITSVSYLAVCAMSVCVCVCLYILPFTVINYAVVHASRAAPRSQP